MVYLLEGLTNLYQAKQWEISDRWWKLSIFSRNSRILKVLAHRMTSKTQKKIKKFPFLWCDEGKELIKFLNLHYGQPFQCWSNFSIFGRIS